MAVIVEPHYQNVVTDALQLTNRTDVVAVNTLRNYLESCMFAVAQSDNLTVVEALRIYGVSVEIVSIFTVEITVIINRVIAVSCPGEPVACSGNGMCDAGRCDCNPGSRSFILLQSESKNPPALSIGIGDRGARGARAP